MKWWRVGLARRQHDPDWLADGTISIYDNNMHRGISRIVNVDPLTYASKIVYSGEEENLNLMIVDVVHLPETFFNIDEFGPCPAR